MFNMIDRYKNMPFIFVTTPRKLKVFRNHKDPLMWNYIQKVSEEFEKNQKRLRERSK